MPTQATAVCEIHGLRFDPAISAGCILCRRDRAASSRPPPEQPHARAAWLAGVLALVLVAAGAVYARAQRGEARRDPTFTRAQIAAEMKQVRVVVYSASWCPSCSDLKTVLWENGIPYEEHDIDREPDARDRAWRLNPERTIPITDVEGDVVVGASPEALGRALERAARRHLTVAPPQ